GTGGLPVGLTDPHDHVDQAPVRLAAVASKVSALHVAQRVGSTLGQRDDVVDARAHRVRPSDALIDGLEAELTGPAVACVDVDGGEHLVCSSLSHERSPSSVVGCGTLWVLLSPVTVLLPSPSVCSSLGLRVVVSWPDPVLCLVRLAPLAHPVGSVAAPALVAAALDTSRVRHGNTAIRARPRVLGLSFRSASPGFCEGAFIASVFAGPLVLDAGAAVG